VIEGCPDFPDARSDIACAISMLIAVSSLESALSPSILKNSQFASVRIVV
jgi:hypothetical protein